MKKYVTERLVIQNVHVSELITKNNLPLFSRPLVKRKNKARLEEKGKGQFVDVCRPQAQFQETGKNSFPLTKIK